MLLSFGAINPVLKPVKSCRSIKSGGLWFGTMLAAYYSIVLMELILVLVLMLRGVNFLSQFIACLCYVNATRNWL